MTREVTAIHTRLLKCALIVDESRAYWPTVDLDAAAAFDAYVFGAKSLARVKVLLTNLRPRFDAYPNARALLRRWTAMDPSTRTLICHWHLMLADPLYRSFTGEWLVARRQRERRSVTRAQALDWVRDQGPGRWTMSTRIQFASKLLSCAFQAGILRSNRDPRPIEPPRVRPEALAYLMYLLRETTIEGSLLDNPYLRSVGLEGRALEDRLADVPGLRFRRQGDLLDYGWQAPDLAAWGADLLGEEAA